MPHMVRMVSKAEHVYAGHRLVAGDEFDCEAQHVSLMETLGRAKPARDADPQQKNDTAAGVDAAPVYQTRAMNAARPRTRRSRA